MRFFRPALAALSCFALLSCSLFEPRAPQAPAPVAAKPGLWKLADEDTTIYLFGTIHVLPDNFMWRNKVIDDAIASADGLVLETRLDPDRAKASAMLMGMGLRPGLPPLVERIDPARRDRLKAMIARSSVPEAALNAMETWTAALMLVGVMLSDLELSPGNGVEEVLEASFTTAKKPIEGLETPEQQLGYFDTLPEAAQRDFLATLVEDPDTTRVEFEAMLKAWASGDEAAIAATFDEEFEVSTVLRDVLLKKRNANWAEWLKTRLDKPGTVFVAVGAGHLAGPDSVQTLLRAKGLETTRVQ